jgi:hypothetical protein
MDRDGRTEKYLLKRIFEGNFQKIESHRFCLLFVRELSKRLPLGVDFCIIELPKWWNWYVDNLFQFRFPTHVNQVADLDGNLDEFKMRLQPRRRTMFNKIIRDKEFTYRISKTLQDFETFYYKMHAPHVKRQFGSAAWVIPPEKMKAMHPESAIFFISDGQRDVAGELIDMENGVLRRRYNGSLSDENSDGWHTSGNALYALSTIYAYELGMKQIDMRHSRPLLDDPVLKVKRSWGAKITVEPDRVTSLYFCNPGNSDAARRFLSTTPFVVITKSGLKAYCTAPPDMEGIELQKYLKKNYWSPGLAGIILCSRDGMGAEELNFT